MTNHSNSAPCDPRDHDQGQKESFVIGQHVGNARADQQRADDRQHAVGGDHEDLLQCAVAVVDAGHQVVAEDKDEHQHPEAQHDKAHIHVLHVLHLVDEALLRLVQHIGREEDQVDHRRAQHRARAVLADLIGAVVGMAVHLPAEAKIADDRDPAQPLAYLCLPGLPMAARAPVDHVQHLDADQQRDQGQQDDAHILLDPGVAHLPEGVGIIVLIVRHLEVLQRRIVILHAQIGLAGAVVGQHGHLVALEHLVPLRHRFGIIARFVQVEGVIDHAGVFRGFEGLQVALVAVQRPDAALAVHGDGGQAGEQAHHVRRGHAGTELENQFAVFGIDVDIALVGAGIDKVVLIHVHVGQGFQAEYLGFEHIAAVGAVLLHAVHIGSAGGGIDDAAAVHEHVGEHGGVGVHQVRHLLAGKQQALDPLGNGQLGLVDGEVAEEFAGGRQLDHAVIDALADDVDVSAVVRRHLFGLVVGIGVQRGIRLGQLGLQRAAAVKDEHSLRAGVRHIDLAAACHIHAAGRGKIGHLQAILHDAGVNIVDDDPLVARIGDVQQVVFIDEQVGGRGKPQLRQCAVGQVGVLGADIIPIIVQRIGIRSGLFSPGAAGEGEQDGQEKKAQDPLLLLHLLILT